VRDDDSADFYRAALADAGLAGQGLPIVTPDLLWLLRHEGLVDRNRVADLVREHFGRFAFILLNDLDAVYLEADIMRAKDERGEGSRS
jgi:hypothetical protein